MDIESFRFTPRLQALNELEVSSYVGNLACVSEWSGQFCCYLPSCFVFIMPFVCCGGCFSRVFVVTLCTYESSPYSINGPFLTISLCLTLSLVELPYPVQLDNIAPNIILLLNPYSAQLNTECLV